MKPTYDREAEAARTRRVIEQHEREEGWARAIFGYVGELVIGLVLLVVVGTVLVALVRGL